MRRRTLPALGPDLFSVGPASSAPVQGREPSVEVTPRPTPTIDLGDIARLIAGWSDAELEQLRIVVANEACRRGRSPPEEARCRALEADRTRAGLLARRPDPDNS